NEVRFHTSFFQRASDRFTATMNEDWIDLDGFEENDIPRHIASYLRIRRIHEAAAVLNDEGCPAEFLNVRQRLQQCGGFCDQVLHRLTFSRLRKPDPPHSLY